MVSSEQAGMSLEETVESGAKHAELAAVFLVVAGVLVRLWAASGTFLNPDEALHFRLANQLSLGLAYQESLTSAHPPLLIGLLYFWRALGTSELWLRLPSVTAGAVFCWVFYKWLTLVAGRLAGVVGLFCVSFLPSVVMLSAEVRQYALLLAFLGSALYFLERALSENSARLMAASTACLCLGFLTHYSAFLFAAALGLYALCMVFKQRVSWDIRATWVVGQLGALALAAALYKSHLSKLGSGESRQVFQGWMSEFYLRRFYFERGHDNPVFFLLERTFSVFQYLCGQLAVGDIVGLGFMVGVVLLLRGKNARGDGDSSRRLGLLLLLSFAIVAGASLMHVYPYGGTRQSAFLIIPGFAGVSVAVARLAAGRWTRGLTIAGVIVLACVIFGKARPPHMSRADQSRKQMTAAMEFIQKNVAPPAVILTDYQTDLVLGHYLCRQFPISFDYTRAGFEEFSCAGYRVISADYKTAWKFSGENFPAEWERTVRAHELKPGDTVWIFQAGWQIDLPEDLSKNFEEFRNLQYESFGKNIKIFKMTVGQPMPQVTAPPAQIISAAPVSSVRAPGE
jgi:4-amino-4-deoxy-L-arabinose transferase-like glycosyltransferase